jgi:hypothetical protein
VQINWFFRRELRFKCEKERKPAVDIIRERRLAEDLGGVEVVSYQNATLAVTGLDDLIFPIPPLTATIFFKPSICVLTSVMFPLPYFGMSIKGIENIVRITHR